LPELHTEKLHTWSQPKMQRDIIDKNKNKVQTLNIINYSIPKNYRYSTFRSNSFSRQENMQAPCRIYPDTPHNPIILPDNNRITIPGNKECPVTENVLTCKIV
jgi:hypothetical protein